jgi:hypothetical protein
MFSGVNEVAEATGATGADGSGSVATSGRGGGRGRPWAWRPWAGRRPQRARARSPRAGGWLRLGGRGRARVQWPRAAGGCGLGGCGLGGCGGLGLRVTAAASLRSRAGGVAERFGPQGPSATTGAPVRYVASKDCASRQLLRAGCDTSGAAAGQGRQHPDRRTARGNPRAVRVTSASEWIRSPCRRHRRARRGPSPSPASPRSRPRS